MTFQTLSTLEGRHNGPPVHVPQSGPDPDSACARAAPVRVLVVDDSARFVAGLMHALRDQPGLEVVGQVGSGEEAIAAVAALSPTIVLMDVAMPGINGLEATRIIKRRPDSPCVVVLTLFDSPAYREAAAEAGADGFLAKTALGHDLGDVLRRICRCRDRGSRRVKPS
jgi:DNA-binding NarL/FixJ family response regulator